MKSEILRKSTILFLLLLFVYAARGQQKEYTEPRLSSQDSWSMILLPDPQSYIKFDYNQPLFDLMLSWVKKTMKPLNTQLVLCTGDLVEQNEFMNPDGINGNQSSKAQWEAAAKAFDKLDGKIPYILATGNHDYGFKSAENRNTHFDRYFPVTKNDKTAALLRDVGLNIDGMPTLANATFEFVSPHGKKYLILVLEFAPRDEILDWAKKIVDQDKYKKHIVILLTHAYMEADNEYIKTAGYKLHNPNYGDAIWQKLIYPSSNIRMVLAGHIGLPDDEKGHLAFRTDKNSIGKKVHQMVFNAQALGGGWHGNGGDGWLRILEFTPDGKTVKVKTFSPLFAISPTTQKYAWRTSEDDEFTFVIE